MTPANSNSVESHYSRHGEQTLRGEKPTSAPFYLLSPYLYLFKKLKPVDRSQKALDLCCGTGQFTGQLLELGFQTDGVDLSTKSIEAATYLHKDAGDQLRLQSGDAQEFLQRNLGYDLIFCAGSLYYLERKKALQQINTALIPGGLYLGVETNGSNLILNFYRRIKNKIKPHQDSKTINELISLAEFDSYKKDISGLEYKYFDFLTLLTGFWPGQLLRKGYFELAKRLDYFILNKLGLRFLAFKVALIYKKPRN